MLREAREAAGLTQAELARRSGVARSAVSMYERGNRVPGADAFLLLMTATGAAIANGGPRQAVDCYRNSQIFTSLTSILSGIPIKASGPLTFPANVWRRSK